MDDGARAAFVIQQVRDVERLLSALPQVGATRWLSVDVIAISRSGGVVVAYAPLSNVTTPDIVRDQALAEASCVARKAVAALPPHISARHVAYAGWQAPSFLAALRTGRFDATLFAARPPWPGRATVFRAARRGGAAVVSLTKSHIDREWSTP